MKKILFGNIAVLAATAFITLGITACTGDKNADTVSDNLLNVSESANEIASMSGNGCYYTVSGNLCSNTEPVFQLSVSQDSVETEEEAVSINGIELGAEYSLEELDAMNFSGFTAEQVLDLYLASDYENVTFINLSYRTVEDVSKLVDKLEQFPNLEQVDMCDCNLSYEVLDSINRALPDTKVVWMIRVRRWAFRTDVVAFCTYQPKVIWTRLDNDDAQLFRYCTDLQALDVGHNSISDYSFLEYLPDLRILIIADNYDIVNGGYVKDISAVKYCTKLQYFEFFICQVTDLSSIQYLTELKDLNLCYTANVDVTMLTGLPNLERLWLNCCGISYDEYTFLQDEYPDTQINYAYAGSTDQGWRNHSRYYAMRDSFGNNYLNPAFYTEEEYAEYEAELAAQEEAEAAEEEQTETEDVTEDTVTDTAEDTVEATTEEIIETENGTEEVTEDVTGTEDV